MSFLVMSLAWSNDMAKTVHMERDYAAINVVLLDGWVMARTEAHLCALIHLSLA